ncbi:MAG: nucleoside 2-deoxyribosyltransferase [Anaerohalosphaera sp.]|nr:nucleoside 2-deoxyribosyltransferase [Anaerohalosphaera sp.]
MKRSNKIYCAGPLFNRSERNEMAQIAQVLRDSDFDVFLPQEDGLEFAQLFPAFLDRGFDTKEAQKILNLAIFSLDVYEVINSDGLVLNMNGRVPDEGAMVEAGIAWSHNKPIVIFNDDERSLIQGSCNPLVVGLSNFDIISEYSQIPIKFKEKFSQVSKSITSDHTPLQFETTKNKGKAISECIHTQKDYGQLAELLITLFGTEPCIKS